MRRNSGINWSRAAGRAAIASTLVATAASAEILAIGAELSTAVQELIDGAPASVTADEAELGVGGAEFPLLTSSELTSTDLDGAIVSLAQAFGEFSDPAGAGQSNPEEFAVEVACYSNVASVSYSVFSDAAESRTLLFTRQGVGPGAIDFGPGGTAELRSSVFFSGAVILWATGEAPAITETGAELRVLVAHGDTGEMLFESTLSVSAGASGGVDTTTTGPLTFETVSLDELADLGLDIETLAVLEHVADTGELVVIVLPPQQHEYTYTVTADEELVLTARLEAHVSNAPDGTGVAATLGRPFEGLVEFMELGLPGVDGEAIQQAINDAVANSDADTPPSDSGRRLCGVLGIESASLMLALMFAGVIRRSR